MEAIDSGKLFTVTVHNGSGFKELVIRASRAPVAMAYAGLVCQHNDEYAGYGVIGYRSTELRSYTTT